MLNLAERFPLAYTVLGAHDAEEGAARASAEIASIEASLSSWLDAVCDHQFWLGEASRCWEIARRANAIRCTIPSIFG